MTCKDCLRFDNGCPNSIIDTNYQTAYYGEQVCSNDVEKRCSHFVEIPKSSSSIKDSGNRRQFDSGAVRDIIDGKGRCDLLPLGVIAGIFNEPVLRNILEFIEDFIESKELLRLRSAIISFATYAYDDIYTAILEVAKHYEEGCKKYGERNWEKGIPLHCYIDSGVRHLLKYARGDKDEPHDRAFIWNMLGAMWTLQHEPELDDINIPAGDLDESELRKA